MHAVSERDLEIRDLKDTWRDLREREKILNAELDDLTKIKRELLVEAFRFNIDLNDL